MGALLGQTHPFWLDSGDPSHPDGRFSILGCDPWGVFRARQGEAWMQTAEGRVDFSHPVDGLDAVMGALAAPPPPEPLPMAGGGVGFLSYDLGRAIERLPDHTEDDLGTDDIFFAFYDWVLVFDHWRSRWHLAATARRPEREPVGRLLERAEAHIRGLLEAAPPLEPMARPSPRAGSSGFSRGEYMDALERAIEHIRAGDIYQVNLSQRFSVEVSEPPFELYRALRRRTRAVFSAYVRGAGARMHVLSLSPERLLRVVGREVETCPIKGTRPRGATPQEDAALAAELVASAKDAAELAMIVDLERNDLGRVCEPGTVCVDAHAELYTLATVHHTVTRVLGRLRPDVGLAALLRATFPGGSITGAPKIRAM